jgi:hypothetical protein
MALGLSDLDVAVCSSLVTRTRVVDDSGSCVTLMHEGKKYFLCGRISRSVSASLLVFIVLVTQVPFRSLCVSSGKP